MRTTKGLQPVHVIYRRIDDDFLDPTVFRRDSMLGVPGLVHAYRAGNVSLANSIGTGIADDKVDVLFRAADDQVLPRPGADSSRTCRPIWPARRPTGNTFWNNLDKLVVKAANESGGYGMLMGPKASKPRDRGVPRVASRPTRAITSPSR